jgi:hypothetical protein
MRQRSAGGLGRDEGVRVLAAQAPDLHLTVARDADVLATLNWAARQLDLPTLADSG